MVDLIYCLHSDCEIKDLHYHCDKCEYVYSLSFYKDIECDHCERFIEYYSDIIPYHKHCEYCSRTDLHVHCKINNCTETDIHIHCKECSWIGTSSSFHADHTHCKECSWAGSIYGLKTHKHCKVSNCIRTDSHRHCGKCEWIGGNKEYHRHCKITNCNRADKHKHCKTCNWIGNYNVFHRHCIACDLTSKHSHCRKCKQIKNADHIC